MGSYLDRLNAEYDELNDGITAILERAAEENREVTDPEQQEVTRAEERQETLQRSIEHYSALEERNTKINALRGRTVPPKRKTPAGQPAEEYSIEREFPTAGDYAVMLHRAWQRRDAAAIEQLERATAHQKTSDNPGIIPRPIVGPLINSMTARRPFVSSIPNHPGPGVPKFDRPRVDQHVDVDIQAAEKDLTASQQLKINPVPVALETFAGHLNISKQDIRWTQPGILQIVFDDFGRVYGRRTERKATADFVAGVTATGVLDAWDIAAMDEFLSEGLASIETAADDVLIDSIWMSRDVWAKLRTLRTPLGAKAYNLPLKGDGDVDGLLATCSRHFPAGTLILGDAAYAEFWEELEGFLSVDEPTVLGQAVGYAGYADTVLLEPKAFQQATLPAEGP